MNRSFLSLLESKQVIIFDGAMGTMLYKNGIFFNRCYEEVNLSMPELVERIHRSYIEAGARVVETNTFGANRFKLTQYGLEDKVREINLAGAQIARRAAGDNGYVAGSIGPLGSLVFPKGKIKPEQAMEAFREQISALLEGNVDLLIIETFRDIDELLLAIRAARDVSELPIIASLTFSEEGPTIFGVTPEQAAEILCDQPIAALGLNCAVGPKPMLDNLMRMAGQCCKPISVMPNAGFPQLVSDRLFYATSPEYFAEYARRFVQMGAQIVGGCCGSTPEHIREIHNILGVHLKQPPIENICLTEVKKEHEKIVQPVGMVPKLLKEKSLFGAKLGQEFVFSVEITPPRGADLTTILETVKILKDSGVDAINIPDSPRASARMNPMAMATIINQKVNIQTIWHYTCRDKSLIGIQADMLGADALGLRNLLLITGDPPKLGDYPNSTGVFDVDSIGLVRIVNNLNQGIDLAGNQLKNQSSFVIGVGANPAAINFEEELNRTILKIKTGAEFILTQPVYEMDKLQRLLDGIAGYNIPVLVGIMPLSSYKMAEFMHNEVPGMFIPESIRNALKQAPDKEKAAEIGMRVALDILTQAKSNVQGAYVMMPLGNHRRSLEIIQHFR